MIGERFWRMLSGVSHPERWFANWAGVSSVASGVTVNENTALNYSAVWAASRILTESIAQLPLKVYRVKRSGGREEARSHPLYSILHDSPNSDMDSFTYRETSSACMINWGNWYSEIIRIGNNHVQELLPLHSSYVEPALDENNNRELYFLVRDDPSRQPRVVLKKNMLHIPGLLSDDGIVGKGVIRMARESIGMGIATERYGAAFFGNGARPDGTLEHPGKLSPEAADRISKQWVDSHGSNKRGIAVLREGMTYKTIGIPPEEAQFLETRVHNVSEIARWYRLPPHMLADLSRAHFTNIEHESLNFVMYSLMSWLTRIERAMNRQLLHNNKEFFIEFNVDGLLRGDKATRTEASMTEFMHGKLTINEWRKQDNQNPVDSKYGDEHFVPMNLVPLDKVEEVIQKSDKPEPEREKEPDGKSAPETPKQNSTALAAAVAAKRAVEKRLLAVEIKAVQQYAKKADGFLGRIEDYYKRHELAIATALEPNIKVIHAIREYYNEDTAAAAALLAEFWAAEHLEEIVSATECKPSELTGRIEQLTQKWLDKQEYDHE